MTVCPSITQVAGMVIGNETPTDPPTVGHLASVWDDVGQEGHGVRDLMDWVIKRDWYRTNGGQNLLQ